jgi:hypothetical protein
MPTKQTKPVCRRAPHRPAAVPARRVQSVLLELAYRLHASRPVAILPRPTGSVA